MVVLENDIPSGFIRAMKGYRVVMLDTEFGLDAIGISAKCSATLAEAGIPVMTYSSYKTDIFLGSRRASP